MGWENARRPLLTDPKDTVKFSWITKLIRLNGELPFQCSNTFNTQTTSRIKPVIKHFLHVRLVQGAYYVLVSLSSWYLPKVGIIRSILLERKA